MIEKIEINSTELISMCAASCQLIGAGSGAPLSLCVVSGRRSGTVRVLLKQDKKRQGYKGGREEGRRMGWITTEAGA